LWTIDTIYYILRKEAFIGTLCQNRTENISYKNKKKRHIPKDKWVRCVNAHEPIIDMETWERTQIKLATRMRPDKINGIRHLFSGKIFCEVCDNLLRKSHSKGYYYFNCRTHYVSPKICDNHKSMRLDILEKVVLDEINKILKKYRNPQKIEIADTVRENKHNKLLEEKNGLISQTEKKNKVIEALYYDKVERAITQEQFNQFSKTAQESLEILNNRIAKIDNELKLGDYNKNANEETKKRIINKYSRIKRLTHEIIDEFIKSIHIGKVIDKNTPREIKIVWNF